MLAALAAAPEVALTGVSAAFIVATAVTALAALGMMMLALHRRARLTIVKSGRERARRPGGRGDRRRGCRGGVALRREAVSGWWPAVTVESPDEITDFQLPTLGSKTSFGLSSPLGILGA